MLVPIRIYVVVLALVTLGLSCAKIRDGENLEEGVVFKIQATGSIPSQWGKVVAVTNVPSSHKYKLQLWLEDEEGRVRVVGYDVRKNRFQSIVLLINRE